MTLLEIVVALAIAGAVVAAGYAAFASITDHRRRADGATETVARAAAIRESLRGWIAGARLSPEESGPPFRGIDGVHRDHPDDVVAFLTSAPTPLGGGLAILRLGIDRDDETPERGLVVELAEWRGAAATRVEIEPRAVGLDIRYLSGLAGRDAWLPSWISSSLLPRAVELRILAAPGDSLHPLLARPLRVPLRAW